MSTMLEKRITELERRTGYAGADPFAERLNPEDRTVYLDFMRRWSASGQEFEVFIRSMGKEELQAMSQLFSRGIGMTDEELRAMELAR